VQTVFGFFQRGQKRMSALPFPGLFPCNGKALFAGKADGVTILNLKIVSAFR